MRGGSRDRQRKIAGSKDRRAVGQSNSRGIDRGERVAQLDITRCRHLDAARAGADDLVTRAAVIVVGGVIDTDGVGGLAIPPNTGTGSGRRAVRNRRGKKLADQDRTSAGLGRIQSFETEIGSEIGCPEIGARSQTVTPGLRIDRQGVADRLQGTEPE